jgi:hypothetical protein
MCLRLSEFKLVTQWTDFRETWSGRYEIGGHPNPFLFRTVTDNTQDVRKFQVQTVLEALTVGSRSNIRQ